MKILKTILIALLFLNNLDLIAQTKDYINAEKKRIAKTEQTEKDVERFITDNFNKYKLAVGASDELIKELREHENFTDAQIEKALIDAKRNELRKLFFSKNREFVSDYKALELPASIAQDCVNGDFEDGTAGYTFWTDLHPQPGSGTSFFQSCATPTVLTTTNVLAPTTNNFNSRATIINSTAAGYQQFDPVLASFGVNVPTLNNNGGTKAIKLNNTGGMGSSDLTTVSRYFPVINQSTIDFNFSLVMDNKPGHAQDIQPYFRARVLDQFGNVVDEFCIIANPNNCLFSTINVNADRRVLYTGWICARLNVGDILNQPGTIEFSVSDCQPSAHFGTVYIDNICGFTCASPQLGAINTNPTNLNCPSPTSTEPIEVCGTYAPPANAVLNSITLQIIQGGVVIATINTPLQLTSSGFCFSFLPSLFGANPSGNYEFQVNADFNVNCTAGTFLYEISDNSANVGPDVTFIDCCIPTLILTSPADDSNNLALPAVKKRERSDWIKAANIISVGDNVQGNGVVYHAENYVELNPGFEAVLGSQFAAYPEGCSSTFVYRIGQEQNNSDEQLEENINLIKLSNGFSIIPNPSSNFIEVVMNDGDFNKVNIATIDGRIVFDKFTDAINRTQIDVSKFPTGIYIINVTTEDGQIHSEKLIKN
ncbi:3-coathanger stack domain-containing protein [Flavobacterium sp.]|uniref:3-coathanger stack domain-containing protein n=1 Tax=Flavobacterium sp. TaxID=239 RepID=UPI0026092F42|nr:3-coathanger stack domain-containing protein [Flavobacterium sp.]